MNVGLPGKRYLTRRLLVDGKVLGLSVVTVDADGEAISYEPFCEECHSTLWVDGPIVVIKAEEVDDYLLSDVEMMLSRGDSFEDVNNYLAASSLYGNSDDVRVAIIF